MSIRVMLKVFLSELMGFIYKSAVKGTHLVTCRRSR
jgi:hypothetical protein